MAEEKHLCFHHFQSPHLSIQSSTLENSSETLHFLNMFIAHINHVCWVSTCLSPFSPPKSCFFPSKHYKTPRVLASYHFRPKKTCVFSKRNCSGWWFGTLFSIYWECHHPNWLSLHIFQRGRVQTTSQVFPQKSQVFPTQTSRGALEPPWLGGGDATLHAAAAAKAPGRAAAGGGPIFFCISINYKGYIRDINYHFFGGIQGITQPKETSQSYAQNVMMISNDEHYYGDMNWIISL